MFTGQQHDKRQTNIHPRRWVQHCTRIAALLQTWVKAAWLQIYCSKSRRVWAMRLSLVCSPGLLMASAHAMRTWASYNHSADEPLNVGTQEGSERSHLQKHCLSPFQVPGNQILLLSTCSASNFVKHGIWLALLNKSERKREEKTFKTKTTATYSSYLPFPSPPEAQFWSHPSFQSSLNPRKMTLFNCGKY